MAGGARLQWDFLQLDDEVDGRISGAADIGVKLDLTPNATLGVQCHVDGIGIVDEFGSLGDGIELDVRFRPGARDRRAVPASTADSR